MCRLTYWENNGFLKTFTSSCLAWILTFSIKTRLRVHCNSGILVIHKMLTRKIRNPSKSQIIWLVVTRFIQTHLFQGKSNSLVRGTDGSQVIYMNAPFRQCHCNSKRLPPNNMSTNSLHTYKTLIILMCLKCTLGYTRVFLLSLLLLLLLLLNNTALKYICESQVLPIIGTNRKNQMLHSNKTSFPTHLLTTSISNSAANSKNSPFFLHQCNTSLCIHSPEHT